MVLNNVNELYKVTTVQNLLAQDTLVMSAVGKIKIWDYNVSNRGFRR